MTDFIWMTNNAENQLNIFRYIELLTTEFLVKFSSFPYNANNGCLFLLLLLHLWKLEQKLWYHESKLPNFFWLLLFLRSCYHRFFGLLCDSYLLLLGWLLWLLNSLLLWLNLFLRGRFNLSNWRTLRRLWL